MGVYVYPVLNKEVPGFDVTEMSGKALAEVMFDGSLFEPLIRFYSINEEELIDFISEQTGQERSEIQAPPEEWFAPEEGLKVVRPLLELVRSQPQSVSPIPHRWEPAVFAEALAED